MKNKLLFILLAIIIFSFPSICFSESKTVVGEDCQIYLGDMKNKKESEGLRKYVRKKSIEDGIRKIDKTYNFDFTEECITDIINKYLEKVVVTSHTERGRKICDKVKITFDPEVIDKYINLHSCISTIIDPYEGLSWTWTYNIDNVLTKKSDRIINIGLIIETKIPDLDEHKKEVLENEDEQQFFHMTDRNKEKYKVIDRRHLIKILEEQKLSSSGITVSETVKLGKILNLDIIVLRILYDKSQVTKVLKVDTGEVLLFRTYKTETEEGWVPYGKTEDGDYYYDKTSLTRVNSKIIRVWIKYKLGKDDIIQLRKKNEFSTDAKSYYWMDFYELDCVNNTLKLVKYVEYDDNNKMLNNYDVPNPKIRQILPESMGESLRRKVCPE